MFFQRQETVVIGSFKGLEWMGVWTDRSMKFDLGCFSVNGPGAVILVALSLRGSSTKPAWECMWRPLVLGCAWCLCGREADLTYYRSKGPFEWQLTALNLNSEVNIPSNKPTQALVDESKWNKMKQVLRLFHLPTNLVRTWKLQHNSRKINATDVTTEREAESATNTSISTLL